uniref:CUB and sushi domain-containing protein 1-like isoform X2 n=1 Tax=Ciona intestinalis TaxID=7719 RepID=UPI000EF53459|nr:CUB and sushi domain-containing protein 1-like isoform X2 [Ciona intestinalis]|eukprot:XP_026692791.1 CUB and sushi domain-containing protein 1-like isoform X2 [Ciona intestinalis]
MDAWSVVMWGGLYKATMNYNVWRMEYGLMIHPHVWVGNIQIFKQNHLLFGKLTQKARWPSVLRRTWIPNLIEADHECSSPYHQWHWRDLSVGLIESIGGLGQCWSPARHGTRIRLALAPCDPINPSQHFKCSDLSLRQCALHVGVEGLWLGRDSDAQHKDNHIYLLSNPGSFQMDWEALEPTAVSLAGNMSYGNTLCRKICGGEINLNEGIIQSPGYPVRYQQNTICRWIIKAPNKMIRFWVTDLDLSPGRDLTDKSCDRDRLTIMEGDEFTEDSAHVLATVCGKLHAGQGPITTVHGKLLLEFRSGNYEVTKRGFQARWVAEALDQPQTECGATSPSSGGNFARLVGGVKEAVENVPWHAAVFSDDVGTRDDNETPLCGATIIRHSYALTAAHCLDHLTSQQQVDKTILGYATSQLWRLTRLSHLLRDSDITVSSMDDDTGASVIRLSRIYSHPTYSENLDSDIVLIKVAEPITWSSRVFPVCLPSPESLLDHVGHGRLHIPKQYCKLAGWGSSSELGRRWRWSYMFLERQPLFGWCGWRAVWRMLITERTTLLYTRFHFH